MIIMAIPTKVVFVKIVLWPTFGSRLRTILTSNVYSRSNFSVFKLQFLQFILTMTSYTIKITIQCTAFYTFCSFSTSFMHLMLVHFL